MEEKEEGQEGGKERGRKGRRKQERKEILVFLFTLHLSLYSSSHHQYGRSTHPTVNIFPEKAYPALIHPIPGHLGLVGSGPYSQVWAHLPC